MNFREAHAKLQEIAAGRYNTISYELTSNVVRGKTQNCRLYVDPKIAATGGTWAEAFKNLDMEMHPHKPIIDTVDEIPELTVNLQLEGNP